MKAIIKIYFYVVMLITIAVTLFFSQVFWGTPQPGTGMGQGLAFLYAIIIIGFFLIHAFILWLIIYVLKLPKIIQIIIFIFLPFILILLGYSLFN